MPDENESENDQGGKGDTGASAPPPDPGKGDTGGKGAGGKDDEADLGEGGKRALRAERQRAAAAEARAQEAERERDELRKQGMSDQEKAVEEARAAGITEATAKANERVVRAEVRAAAAGKLVNPADAALYLDLSKFKVDDATGDVDSDAISSAIDELVKDRPYLAATASDRPGRLPGGGARPSGGGNSIDDQIRRAAGVRP